MKLTQIQDSRPNDKFPTVQLFILGEQTDMTQNPPLPQLTTTTALCRVAEPIALTSIFPYSWLMVKGFHIGDRSDASFYAGILISAFALAESLTGMFWGALSDRIGRKPVLLLGCFGTMLSLLVVGFSTNFTVALLGRVLGGVLNGNIGTAASLDA